MKKRLKEYGFDNITQYWEMCIESYINGQKKQANEQFMAMSKVQRKGMLWAILFNPSIYGGFAVYDNQKEGITKTEIQQFFFDLL